MKSLLSALVILMFLAHLVTGNWYVKKCANTLGNCRKKCRDGEQQTQPATSKCPVGKLCCVLDFKVTGQCGSGGAMQSSGQDSAAGTQASAGAGASQAAGGTAAAGGTPGTPAAGTTAAASTAAP